MDSSHIADIPIRIIEIAPIGTAYGASGTLTLTDDAFREGATFKDSVIETATDTLQAERFGNVQALQFSLHYARYNDEYAQLLGYDRVKVRVTVGFDSNDQEIYEFPSTILESLEFLNNDGDATIPITVRQVKLIDGAIITPGIITLGYGNGNPSGNQFSITALSGTGGYDIVKDPVRSSVGKNYERIEGYYHKINLKVSPKSYQSGQDKIERFLFSNFKYIRAIGFHSHFESGFRQVEFTESALDEELVNDLRAGRMVIIKLRDTDKQTDKVT